MSVRRLELCDVSVARQQFSLMAEVFGEQAEEFTDAQLQGLLGDPKFWAVAAFAGDNVIGGITAHTIPMTTKPAAALFVYDIAVRADQQRRGIGRELLRFVRAEASRLGIDEVFVLADDDDTHALAFYGSLGATPSAVTMFDLGAKAR